MAKTPRCADKGSHTAYLERLHSLCPALLLLAHDLVLDERLVLKVLLVGCFLALCLHVSSVGVPLCELSSHTVRGVLLHVSMLPADD